MKKMLSMALPIAAALLAGCRGPAPAGDDGAPKVEGARVEIPPGSPQSQALQLDAPRVAPGVSLHLNGRLAWDQTVTVGVYPAFSGRVTQVIAEPGQRVEAGAVLARIESADYAQVEEDAAKAVSDRRLAERSLARVRDLEEHGAAARKDLEAAEADLAHARAESERTASRLAAYGDPGTAIDGSYALRAPIAGVVVERNLGPGQELRADQFLAGTPQLAVPLFTITDPTRLWVMIDASEHDAPHLHPGDPFSLRLHVGSAEGRSGRIEAVSDFLDPVTRTVRVRGSLENPEPRLRAEMLVGVDVEPRDAEPVPEVPATAVLLQGERHYLYVEDGPGRFERREVALGPEQGDWLRVLHGLDGGRRVVTAGAILLEQIYQDHLGS